MIRTHSEPVYEYGKPPRLSVQHVAVCDTRLLNALLMFAAGHTAKFPLCQAPHFGVDTKKTDEVYDSLRRTDEDMRAKEEAMRRYVDRRNRELAEQVTERLAETP